MHNHPHPHRFHREFHGLQDSQVRHDETRHDDVVEVTFRALERLLSGVEGEAVIAIPEVFDFRQPRTENIRHDGRLHKDNAQGFLPAGRGVAFARAKSPLADVASQFATALRVHFPETMDHGFSIPKPASTTGAGA